MREQIVIRKGPDAWYADSVRHIDPMGRIACHVRCIPTPWLPHADPQMVLANIKSQNPDADVSIGDPISIHTIERECSRFSTKHKKS